MPEQYKSDLIAVVHYLSDAIIEMCETDGIECVDALDLIDIPDYEVEEEVA